jgi:hypothetical protein
MKYFNLHNPDDNSTPPGLFSELVEFSRNTSTMMYEVRRLLALEVLNTAGKIKPRIDPRLPDGQWSEELLSTLTAVISSNRATIKSGFISRWQDNCTSYLAGQLHVV